MMDKGQRQRRRLVLAATRRVLDVPDDAPIDELKTAVGALGIDVDAALARVQDFVREYPRRLVVEAKTRQESDRKAFQRFQDQLAATDISTLQEQIRTIMASAPVELSGQTQAYHRELSAKTGEDVRSELVDLLWQLTKSTKHE